MCRSTNINEVQTLSSVFGKISFWYVDTKQRLVFLGVEMLEKLLFAN